MQISKKTAGFSVIEVMIAAAVFIIFASGSVAVVLQGFDFNRTGRKVLKRFALLKINLLEILRVLFV